MKKLLILSTIILILATSCMKKKYEKKSYDYKYIYEFDYVYHLDKQCPNRPFMRNNAVQIKKVAEMEYYELKNGEFCTLCISDSDYENLTKLVKPKQSWEN